MKDKYIIEVRDEKGLLDFRKEEQVQKQHPYLFAQDEYTIDELAHYASYGQDRNKPVGPMEMGPFYKEIGISYRRKYW